MNRFIQKMTKLDIDGLEQVEKDAEAIAAEAKAPPHEHGYTLSK